MDDFQKYLDKSLSTISFDDKKINDDFLEVDLEILYKSIINEIALTRKKLGISQKELSQRTGIPQANISKIENGTANPSLKLLIRLGQGLNKKIVIKFE